MLLLNVEKKHNHPPQLYQKGAKVVREPIWEIYLPGLTEVNLFCLFR